jgi:hypothetical protein
MENAKKVRSFTTKALLPGFVGLASIVAVSSSAQAGQTIVNFGTNFTGTDAMGRHYTSITTLAPGPFALSDVNNTLTGASLTVSNPNPPGSFTSSGAASGTTTPNGTTTPYNNGFNQFNFGGGTGTPTGQAAALGYSGSVTGTSGYTNTTYFQGSGPNQVPEVELTLSGLNPTQLYSFDIFGSRTGVTDVRSADYTISGGSGGTASTTLVLVESNNTGNVVSAGGFTPSASGNITFLIQADAATNTNANGFTYTSILEIDSSPAPEPTSAAGMVLAGGALLRRRRRTIGTVV